MKTHFAQRDASGTELLAACRRGSRLTVKVYQVDCLLCKNTPAFIKAKEAADAAREAAFNAQTPRTVVPQFGRVNDAGVMECPICTGVLWRERPRSLFSFHFVCAECGNSVHPLTETGMST